MVQIGTKEQAILFAKATRSQIIESIVELIIDNLKDADYENDTAEGCCMLQNIELSRSGEQGYDLQQEVLQADILFPNMNRVRVPSHVNLWIEYSASIDRRESGDNGVLFTETMHVFEGCPDSILDRYNELKEKHGYCLGKMQDSP